MSRGTDSETPVSVKVGFDVVVPQAFLERLVSLFGSTPPPTCRPPIGQWYILAGDGYGSLLELASSVIWLTESLWTDPWGYRGSQANCSGR